MNSVRLRRRPRLVNEALLSVRRDPGSLLLVGRRYVSIPDIHYFD